MVDSFRILFDILIGSAFGFKVFAAVVYIAGGSYLMDYYRKAKPFSQNTLNLLFIAGIIGFGVAFKSLADFDYAGVQRIAAIISGIIGASAGFFLFISNPGRDR